MAQPPSAGAIHLPPSHGICVDALRPACDSCEIRGMGEYRRIACTTLRSAASLASEYKPRSAAVMRPCALTAVASVLSMPASDRARWPRWIMCQSLAEPSSSAEYWNIGAMAMRFFNCTGPSAHGENNWLMVVNSEIDSSSNTTQFFWLWPRAIIAAYSRLRYRCLPLIQPAV